MANIIKVNDELKFYKAQLKSNESVISDLLKENKHIKEHIKFLQSKVDLVPMDVPVEEERNQWDAPEPLINDENGTHS